MLGSRLCLNVRGMIWQDDDIIITGVSSATGAALQSRTHPERDHWPAVVVDENQPELSEFEMRELRSMRNVKFA